MADYSDDSDDSIKSQCHVHVLSRYLTVINQNRFIILQADQFNCSIYFEMI